MEKETINNKAIEEFIFIAELSCKCISDYLKLVEDKDYTVNDIIG